MSPRRASPSQVDLTKAFNGVTRALKENQQALNAADEYNHNHGDNMVANFKVITKAVREKKGAQPAEQLAAASQALSHRSQSGSAQLYAQGLAQAAERFQGQRSIQPQDAMQLVQALMGGQAGAEQSQAASGDLLGGVLGSLLGSGTSAQSQAAAGDDLVGGLLGALTGGGAMGQPSARPAGGENKPGIDLNDMMNAGMAFFQARQEGAAPLQALIQAVMAGSQMQATPHHSQSGQLVAQTLLSSIGTMLNKKQ